MNYHNNKNTEEGIIQVQGIHKTASPYQAPASYFERLTTEVLSAVAAASSENDPDTDLFPKTNIFSIPRGYFDTFPETIREKVRAADAIITGRQYGWNDLQKSTPYHLPENYFERFEQALHHRLFGSETEIEGLSPLLNELRTAQPLAVPEGYFAGDMAEKAAVQAQEMKPKAVEHPSVKSIRWASWAAAAAVLIIFGMGGWHFLSPSSAYTETSFEQRLAAVPEGDIQNYINNNLEEFDINMIENSISQAAKSDMATTVLSGISDAEIEAYLNGEI